MGGLVERARLGGAPATEGDEPADADGSDLASFIAELRAEIESLRAWKAAAEARGGAPSGRPRRLAGTARRRAAHHRRTRRRRRAGGPLPGGRPHRHLLGRRQRHGRGAPHPRRPGPLRAGHGGPLGQRAVGAHAGHPAAGGAGGARLGAAARLGAGPRGRRRRQGDAARGAGAVPGAVRRRARRPRALRPARRGARRGARDAGGGGARAGAAAPGAPAGRPEPDRPAARRGAARLRPRRAGRGGAGRRAARRRSRAWPGRPPRRSRAGPARPPAARWRSTSAASRRRPRGSRPRRSPPGRGPPRRFPPPLPRPHPLPPRRAPAPPWRCWNPRRRRSRTRGGATLEAAVLLELRGALRGRTAEELVRVCGAPAARIDAALELLAGRGAVARRGPRWCMA